MYCRYKFDFFMTHPHIKRPCVPLTPYVPTPFEEADLFRGYQPKRLVIQQTSTILPALGKRSNLMLSKKTGNVYLPDDANADQTLQWMVKNNFEHLTMLFQGQTAEDLRRLTLQELKKLCLLSDGKRLFQSLHQGRMTVYINHDSFQPRTITLKPPSSEGFRSKLLDSFKDQEMSIRNIHILARNNKKMELKDSEIALIMNGTTFECQFTKDGQYHDLLLVEAY